MFIFTRKKGLQKPKPFCIFAKGKKKKNNNFIPYENITHSLSSLSLE